ncbi:MAG: amidohydrolase family protein [bacterium]|jgi:imidazolonepropionase-like amidohydrolase
MYKVLKAKTLIDGKGGQPIPEAAILIEDGVIRTAGPAQAMSWPDSAEVIDLGEKTVMPGMIDCHVHIGSNGEARYELLSVKELTPYKALKAALHARTDLEAGFTTLRDMGEGGYIDIAVRQAINAGLYTGPRLVVSGHSLSITGGHGDSHFIPEVRVTSKIGVVDGPDAARKAAREQLKYGADVLKLCATGGVMSEGTEPGAQQLSYDEMKAAIDEFKKLGKTSAAHAQGTKGIKDAIRAGITSIEHGFFLDAEAIQMMLDNNVYLVPTLVAVHGIVTNGVEAGIPEYAVNKARMAQAAHLDSFRRALAAGVKIAMGTDAGTPFNYHGKNAFELELLVKAGMTPQQAIQATTKTAAELLQIEKMTGTLEAGKSADIIAVDGDPLTDIKLLQSVKFVMKEGKIIRS